MDFGFGGPCKRILIDKSEIVPIIIFNATVLELLPNAFRLTQFSFEDMAQKSEN